MILPQDIIRKKRDGHTLNEQDIQAFVDGLTTGHFTDPQVAAMAMAIYLNGMKTTEIVTLTQAMKSSGKSLNWKNIVSTPVVDKHSTGGVGDKVTLMLAPIVAACGLCVPSITGRGLGHTGGTVDKLESISGLNMQPDLDQLMDWVAQNGAAIISQTDQLAPADRRLYSLRDITATVESIPLITASILSKKLAEGLDALVMDVKVGSGAMMNNLNDARALARSIVDVGNGAGMKTEALLTDMNQVLGYHAGNALEIIETLDYLSGKRREPRLHQVVMSLAIRMLIITGVEDDEHKARVKVEQALNNGDAEQIFADMIVKMGGPADLFEHPQRYLARAQYIVTIESPQSGYLTQMDVRGIGMLIVAIGGGRIDHHSEVNPAVGLENVLGLGSYVEVGQALAVLHVDCSEHISLARQLFLNAITISDQPESVPAVILEHIR